MKIVSVPSKESARVVHVQRLDDVRDNKVIELYSVSQALALLGVDLLCFSPHLRPTLVSLLASSVDKEQHRYMLCVLLWTTNRFNYVSRSKTTE